MIKVSTNEAASAVDFGMMFASNVMVAIGANFLVSKLLGKLKNKVKKDESTEEAVAAKDEQPAKTLNVVSPAMPMAATVQQPAPTNQQVLKKPVSPSTNNNIFSNFQGMKV
jgi:hypothetical protein